MFRRFAKRRNCSTLREPHSRQSDVQFRGRDQKVSALSFHVTLAQMRLARWLRQVCGVAVFVSNLGLAVRAGVRVSNPHLVFLDSSAVKHWGASLMR